MSRARVLLLVSALIGVLALSACTIGTPRADPPPTQSTSPTAPTTGPSVKTRLDCPSVAATPDPIWVPVETTVRLMTQGSTGHLSYAYTGVKDGQGILAFTSDRYPQPPAHVMLREGETVQVCEFWVTAVGVSSDLVTLRIDQ